MESIVSSYLTTTFTPLSILANTFLVFFKCMMRAHTLLQEPRLWISPHHVCSIPKCLRSWFIGRGIAFSVLGITCSCNLEETILIWSAWTLILRTTLFYSHRAWSLHNLPFSGKLRSLQSPCRLVNTRLSVKLIIRHSWLWFYHWGIWRIQITIPIPGRTSWSPHPPGSSPNLAQDSLCLLHDQLFLALSHHDGRSASFCLGLVSVCILFSLWNTLRSMDNMPAWEPMSIWRNIPQADLVTTTLATSQKILGFSWIEKCLLMMSPGTSMAYWLTSLPHLDQFLRCPFLSLSFVPGDTSWQLLLPKLEISNCFITSPVLWMGRVC